MPTSYPAKILLFGEHTVLRGGRGLAVPYPKFSLAWERIRPDERLLKFGDYLRVAIPQFLDYGRLEDDLLNDWCLTGGIPHGYGLGSSGAVCAAIWDRYANAQGRALSGEPLRDALSRMEQHFHGQSSGTDPLISYLNQPLLLGGGQPPRPVNLPADWQAGFFLLDTGVERQAANLIRQFTRRYDTDAAARDAIDRYWMTAADQAIDALVAGNKKGIWEAVKTLSTAQLRLFPEAIPSAYQSVWEGGEAYALKICGAGGGGMLLGYARDRGAVNGKFGSNISWL